jgi:hypothetical protein
MTMTLDKSPSTASGMSVVGRNLDTEEEVDEMTATTVFQHQYAAPAVRRARPHGLDRLVMRLSLAMLLWARQRADRSMVSHEEHAIRRANELAIERDRHSADARIARVF